MNKLLYRARLVRRSLPVTVLAAILCIPLAVSGEESGSEDLPQNAATEYWRAMVFFDQPTTPEELAVISFIDNDMAPLPPGVLTIRPDVNRWLLEQTPSMLAMARAGEIPLCRFSTRQGRDTEHLIYIKSLTQRALQAAKAYEYVNNKQGAAMIYVSLFRTAMHLDQDKNMTSVIFAAELVQRVLDALIGFVSREPSLEAAEVLTRFFAEAPPEILHLNACLDADAAALAKWLTDEPGLTEQRLATRYGSTVPKPAVERLMTLDPDRKAERLAEWVAGYEAHMRALSEAATKPYAVGVYTIQELDAQRNSLKDAPQEDMVNPLVPLLAPTIEKTYERILLAEGHFTLADVLSATALYRASTKDWPKSLEDLSKFVGRPFGRDPYTGQIIQYALKRNYPVLALRAPRWLAKDPNILYQVNLGTRLNKDQTTVARMVETFGREKRREKIKDRQQAVER